MKYNYIEVRAARTQQDVLNCQCDEIRQCDTIKEAKEYAKYVLTNDFQKVNEMSEPLQYAAIYAGNGDLTRKDIVYDFFANKI